MRGWRRGTVRLMAVGTMVVRPMAFRMMRALVLVAEAGRVPRERGAERHQLHAEEREQQDEAMGADAGAHDRSV